MDKRDKVLLVAITFPPALGGSAAVYGNLAKHADGRIIVLASQLNYQDDLPIIGWREQDRMAGYRTVRSRRLRTMLRFPPEDFAGRIAFFAADLALRARLLWRILRLVHSEPIGAVCIGEVVPSGWLVPLLRRLLPVRIAVYVHGEEIILEEPYDPDHSRAARAMRAAHRIIAVSEFSRRAVCDLIGAEHADKVCLIENGVDVRQFSPAGRRADLVQAYGLAGKFVYVTVCRLLEKKGVDMAIRASARVHALHPDTRFVVVGTGPYEEELHRLATALGLSEVVVFAGNVSPTDLVAHYCLGDVFVMPNRALANGDTEGFGLVFLEANACGLPVIGGRDGGTASAVHHGENGLLVNGHDEAEIAAAMLQLREDDALRARIAATGRVVAAQSGWQAKATTFMTACLEE
jgi:phosphatidylinositol alpha-1,6-mannosyltransferase